MNDMNYWKLLGSTAVLTLMFCVGIFLYARWDLKRFEESLGAPPPPISGKTESTEDLGEQTTFGKPVTFKTDEELGFVKRQETEPHITDTAEEEASVNESLDELEDEGFDARRQNSDITDAAENAFADFLQEQIANSSEKGSISSIVIEGLDATQASDWIEIDGDLRVGDIIDIKGLGKGDHIIIDETGVIQSTE